MFLFDDPRISCPIRTRVDRQSSTTEPKKAATLNDVADAVEDAIREAQQRDIIAIKKQKEKRKGRKKYN